MKKQIMLCMVFLVLISFASAETFSQSQESNFTKTCTNATGSTCNAAANCELTLKAPRTNGIILQNVSMTNNKNGLFNYTFTSDTLAALGDHDWDMFCCEGNNCGEGHGTFKVTKTGVELSQEKALVYMGMMGLLLFMFIAVCFAIPFLPSKNNKDESGEFFISVNNLKYLRPVAFAVAWGLLLAIVFVASNISYLYLETEMMGKLLFVFYQIMMWLTLPMVVVWFLLIISNFFRDKEMKELIDRGVQISSKAI